MRTGKSTFKIWQSPKNGRWYWHLRNEFGEIYANHGGLNSKRTARAGIDSVKRNAPNAVIEEVK